MGENGANASFVPKQPRQRRKMLPCQSLATGVAWGEQQIGKKNEKGTRRWWLNHQRFFFLGVFFSMIQRDHQDTDGETVTQLKSNAESPEI
jgi:hypothetical protein